MPTNICIRRLFLLSCAGWALRRFDSLVLSKVPGVVLCLFAQGESTFLRTARYEALLAPRIGAQPFLANRRFATWMSGDPFQNVAGSGSVRLWKLRICSIPRKG